MRKITKDEFISKSVSSHGNIYDYSKVDYVNSRTKIEIVCPLHGGFFQTPAEHMRGYGCKKCGYKKVSANLTETLNDFIEKGRNVHEGKYLYSNIRKENGIRVVDIKCQTHGWFTQTTSEHLKGHGCKKCGSILTGDKKRKQTDIFINEAISVHGDKYIYNNVLYLGAHKKVIVECPEHGFFEIRPCDHLRGSGCKICAPYGFDLSKAGILYTLLSEDELYLKIGITGDLPRRLNELKRATPFNFSLVNVVHGNGEKIFKMEKEAHSQMVSADFSGFDGCTEWFVVNSDK